jgi:hypothetical protein
MQSVSFCLGEVSQHVFDAVQAAAKNVPNVGVNIVNMEIRNMGVVTNSAHKFTDAEFEQIMRIFMSEQPHSTGHITVKFAWHLTTESQQKLFQLMNLQDLRNNTLLIHLGNYIILFQKANSLWYNNHFQHTRKFSFHPWYLTN